MSLNTLSYNYLNPFKVNRFHSLRYKLTACLRCSPALFLAVAVICPGASEAGRSGAIAPGYTSQDQESAETPGVRLERVLALCGAGAAIHYLGFRYFDRAWYQGEKRDSIRWINDWSGDTYLNLDKGGHFMGGLFLSSLFSNAYSWAGFDTLRDIYSTGHPNQLGGAVRNRNARRLFRALGFQHSRFRLQHAGCRGAAGSRHLSTASRAIGFKFSYWPSPALSRQRVERSREQRPHTDHLIDDYQGMTFWMTLAVEQFLPDREARIWPDFLGVALGYSAIGSPREQRQEQGAFQGVRIPARRAAGDPDRFRLRCP